MSKKTEWRYITTWCDKKGKTHTRKRRTIDYACEDFRKAQGNARHAVLARLHADQQTTLAEWPK